MKSKLLIVDDDKLTLESFELLLAPDGYELHLARNGREALTKARDLQPDLMLLDVLMPGLDGFEVCRRIRADPAIGRMPIIMLTALEDQASRLEGLRAGADDFLTKPCVGDELRARVRTVVALNRFRVISEERARFQQLFALAPAAILIIDETGRVISANEQAETMFVTPAVRTVVGCDILARFAGREAVALHAAIRIAVWGATPAPTELQCGDGPAARRMVARAAPLPETGKQLVMLVLDDVTAEAQTRESLKKMNSELDELVRARTRQLEEANSLLLSYASFVTHDLRSPLTAIRGYLGMLRDGMVPENSDAHEAVERSFQATTMMTEMVQNILQLARDMHGGDAPPARVVDPRPTIERLVAHFSNLHPNRGLKFVIGALPSVGVSAVLVERVFFNLLANAVKFSAQRPDPLIEVGGRTEANGPVLYVRDNGIGFDGRDTDKVFQEFSRLPAAAESEGLGLGLALVTRLLRAHQGRIWAESRVGEGATFYVQLAPPAGASSAEPLPFEAAS